MVQLFVELVDGPWHLVVLEDGLQVDGFEYLPELQTRCVLPHLVVHSRPFARKTLQFIEVELRFPHLDELLPINLVSATPFSVVVLGTTLPGRIHLHDTHVFDALRVDLLDRMRVTRLFALDHLLKDVWETTA